jgi:PTH1 family peptidyl-tRNA hydrolase
MGLNMQLIVGLGNPGLQYRHSRHNIGFRCIELMAKRWGIPLSDRRAKAVIGQGHHAGHEIVLAKPRTFMNNSGEGIAYLLTRFGSHPSDLVIIHDDLDIPLSKLRIRPDGSDGGHRGVRSIINNLGTQAFPRIRVGISRPLMGQDQISYVLDRCTDEEMRVTTESIEMVVQAVDCILHETIDAAMNRFN